MAEEHEAEEHEDMAEEHVIGLGEELDEDQG